MQVRKYMFEEVCLYRPLTSEAKSGADDKGSAKDAQDRRAGGYGGPGT